MASEGYRVYDYHKKISSDNIPTVFILDYSNSMNERISGETKYNILKRCFENLVSQIPDETPVGVRVYGHRWGFTNYDACKASVMAEGINKYNRDVIPMKLSEYRPRGMTPITYSLKQAIKNDFIGFPGKKHIILLTDGGENCDESPCKFAMELIKVRKDVVIDVIAFNIDNEDDLAQLECTSLVTSGKFYTANTAAELANSLNSSLNARKEVDARIVPNY